MRRIIFFVLFLGLVLMIPGLETAQTQAPNATIEERIKERRESIKTKIDAQRSQAITRSCQNIQTRASFSAERISEVKTERLEKYQKISSIFEELSDSINAAGIDTTEIDEEIEIYNEMLSKFSEYIENLALSLEDLENIDCANSPQEVEDALTDARNNQKDAKNEALKIKAQIEENISELLDQIITELST